MTNIKCIIFCISCSLLIGISARAETITVKDVTGGTELLAYKVLQLAIEKSGSSVEFNPIEANYNEARLVSEVESGHLDVIWAGAAQDKDERLLAVRIPILKGLLGHRIFIIRKQDEYKFSQIKSLQELKSYYGGQGTFWGDTKVLKNAGLPTITTIKYANLFPMLEGGRFDYFPRAVHEPWSEVENHAEFNLVVDKNIMLIYPFAQYFYVNKNNRSLHDTIYRGFEAAIEDGSFDKLFFNDPSIQQALKNAELSKRHVFRINNPYMHPDTPTDRPEFWLDVNSI